MSLIMDKVEFILSICKTIYQMAENVKANKERCQRVAKRVKALQELVLTIKQRGPGQCSAPVENALKELCTTLTSAKTLMMKYSKTKAVMSFLNSKSHEDQFCKMNERLTDNLQVLSGALQVEQGNILHKVYETVAGKRQDEEYWSGQASSTISTNSVTPPSTITCMPMSIPTSPLPPPSIMSPMPVSSPTTAMPAPVIMSPMPMSSPTSPVSPPSIMSAMPMSSPTTPMPAPTIMSPMTLCRPTTASSVRCIVSPQSVTIPIAPIPLRGTMPPLVVSSTMTPNPVLRIIAPVRAPFAPVTLSTQNASVIRSCVVNSSYFP
ncbi:uncharacterized protein LOC143321635 [Chaetodon auriga]|uniref:uncharacterized protein LOC143321635 n=1 Tax=Chaetodon auriga TaxID=39042 RepID=UPI004032AFA1